MVLGCAHLPLLQTQPATHHVATAQPVATQCTACVGRRSVCVDLFAKLTQSALYKQAEEADRALEGTLEYPEYP